MLRLRFPADAEQKKMRGRAPLQVSSVPIVLIFCSDIADADRDLSDVGFAKQWGYCGAELNHRAGAWLSTAGDFGRKMR